ncbi:MAG: response regulator [Spirochaetales bacterium]|nr:response regulator [Spirochaetales bacterium]
MYTLLIADDEPLECAAIELLVTRAKLPLRVLKARNGREAVDLARRHKPHIVFLDIQMPGMDGIEAGKLIRSDNDECQIVYLTAWPTFDFARAAIRIGVAEYLVKPVQHTEVYALLDRLIAHFDRLHEDERKQKEEIRSTLNLFSREFFAAMKFSRLTPETMKSYFIAQGITLEEGVVIIIGGLKEEEAQEYFSREPFWQRLPISYFPSIDRTTVLLFTTQAAKKIEEVKAFFQGSDLTVGTGLIFENLEQIPQSILTASITYCTAYQEGLSFLRYNPALMVSQSREELDAISSLILTETLQGNTGKARTLAHRLIDNAQRDQTNPLPENLTVISHEIHKSVPFLPRRPIPADSVMEQEAFLMDLIDSASEAVLIDRLDRHKRAFEYVDRYLHTHMGLPLTSEDLAKKVSLNTKYFGRLFKRYLGSTFVEHLTKIRMEKAYTLLEEGEYTVKTVAELTGYQEPGYFTRVFRRYHGVTPSSVLES